MGKPQTGLADVPELFGKRQEVDSLNAVPLAGNLHQHLAGRSRHAEDERQRGDPFPANETDLCLAAVSTADRDGRGDAALEKIDVLDGSVGRLQSLAQGQLYRCQQRLQARIRIVAQRIEELVAASGTGLLSIVPCSSICQSRPISEW